MIGFIYMITSPSGRIYIGQTKDVNKRIVHYKQLLCKTQPKLYNSLVKYNFENHKLDIIDNCLEYLLDEREIYWISYYDSYNNGLNGTPGGMNSRGWHHSEETKDKIRQSNTGKKQSPEHIEKNRISKTGIKQSQETIDKRRESCKDVENEGKFKKGNEPWNKGKTGHTLNVDKDKKSESARLGWIKRKNKQTENKKQDANGV